MAVTAAQLDAGHDVAASDTTITTGSVTFGSGNKKVILFVQTGNDGGGGSNLPTDTQSGTWSLIGSTSNTSDNQILFAYERTGGSVGVSGTVTATFGSPGWYVPHWSLIELTGSVGALTVVGSLAGTSYFSASSAPTVDCSGAASANAVLAAMSMYINAAATSPTSPWSELTDDVDGYFGGLAVQFRPDNGNTATFTLASGTANAIGIGVEISEAAGGGGGVEILRRRRQGY